MMENSGIVEVYSEDHWTSSVDNALKELVSIFGTKNRWGTIAKQMPIAITGKACRHRWTNVLSGSGVKGHWKEEEDRIILLAVSQGMNKWSEIAKLIPGRIGKQCRERWFNHLSPELKKTPWTAEEDDLLIATQAKIGNSWSKVTLEIPGRSENEVKNRWYSAVIRRKLCATFYSTTSSSSAVDEVMTGHKRQANNEVEEGCDPVAAAGMVSRCVTFPDTVATDTIRTVAATTVPTDQKRVRYTLSEDDMISLHIAELYLQGIMTGRISTSDMGVGAAAVASGVTSAKGSGKSAGFRNERFLVPEEMDQNSIASVDTIQRDFQKYCIRFQEGLTTNCSGVMESISGLTTPYSLSVSCSPLWAGLISSPASPK